MLGLNFLAMHEGSNRAGATSTAARCDEARPREAGVCEKCGQWWHDGPCVWACFDAEPCLCYALRVTHLKVLK